MKGQTMQRALQLACQIVNEGERPAPSAWPASAASKLLARRAQAGSIARDRVVFGNQDKALLANWLGQQGIDPAIGVNAKPDASRIETARYQADEKGSSASIGASRRMVALAPAGAGAVYLNAAPLPRRSGSFTVIQATPQDHLDAEWLMTVENLEAFLALIETVPSCLPAGAGVLVMRSSYSFPFGQSWVMKQANGCGIPHIHAPDLDPHGLSHVLEMQADYAFLPSMATLATANYVCRPELFWKQDRLHTRLAERMDAIAPSLRPWLDWMLAQRSAVTQESMLAANLPFCVVRACQRPNDNGP